MIDYKKKITFKNIDQEFVNISERIEKLKIPKGFLEFMLYSISELFANIKEHSRARNISIEIKINKKNCSIKISDKGIGFRKSYLLKKFYPKDDFAAVEFALSGLSTKDLQERGFGLYSIRKLIQALGGKMVIESGLARAIIQKNKITFKNASQKIPGVSINLESFIKKLDFYKIIK